MIKLSVRAKNALARPISALRSHQDRTSARRALHALDDHLLRDIGLARADLDTQGDRRYHF